MSIFKNKISVYIWKKMHQVSFWSSKICCSLIALCFFSNVGIFFPAQNNFSYCTWNLQHSQNSADKMVHFHHSLKVIEKKKKYSWSLLRKCHKTQSLKKSCWNAFTISKYDFIFMCKLWKKASWLQAFKACLSTVTWFTNMGSWMRHFLTDKNTISLICLQVNTAWSWMKRIIICNFSDHPIEQSTWTYPIGYHIG